MRCTAICAVVTLLAIAACTAPRRKDWAPRPVGPPPPEGGVRVYGADVPTVTTVMLGRDSAQRDQKTTPLDGGRFAITLNGGGRGATQDEFVFEDGKFQSDLCTKAGFERVPYETTPMSDGSIGFRAKCDSPIAGRQEWAGVVRGDRVDGTVVTTSYDGTPPVNTVFSGARK